MLTSASSFPLCFRLIVFSREPEPVPSPADGAAVDANGPPVASSRVPHNWLDRARSDPSVSASQVENAKALWRVLPIFAVLPAFWMLFDQQSSAWILQADQMKLYGLEPEQIGVANPLLVMLLLPLMDRVIYPLVGRCVNFTPLRRMGVGMLVAVLAFLASAGVQHLIDTSSPKSLTVFLQLPQITLISVAEILISVTGLEFAYTQATPALKSSITAVFLLTTAVGNLLTGVLYSAVSRVMGAASIYAFFAGLMLLNWLAFLVVARKYRPVVVVDATVHAPEDEEEAADAADAAADADEESAASRQMLAPPKSPALDRSRSRRRSSTPAPHGALVDIEMADAGRSMPAHIKRASTTSFLGTMDDDDDEARHM